MTATPSPSAQLTAARRSDLGISLVLLGVFGAALYTSFDWSAKAALFPRMVTGLGLSLAVLSIVLLTRRLMRPEPVQPSAERPSEELLDAEAVPEHVFATASAREWLVALAWVAGFFIALYYLGMFVAAAIFAAAYLRYQAQSSWRFSIVYPVVMVVVLYTGLEYLLGLDTPPSRLF